jgi:6,7-dimethyl-8-ribityllumazine synthase
MGPPRVAIVVSRYNETATNAMLEGALAAYAERFAASTDQAPDVFRVPGAFELPVVCAHACEIGEYDAVLALGCVVRGETDHDKYISHAVADSLARLSCESGVPVSFGVLTVNTPEQAFARSCRGDEPGGKGNKGREAMHAALDTLAVLEAMHVGTDELSDLNAEGDADRPNGLRFTSPIADKLAGHDSSSH